MKTLGYYNGKYAEIEEMTIPMNDRVCFFGDGIYDATYARHYNIFALQEHLDRFFHSASLLQMNLPYTKEKLGNILKEMVKKLDDDEQFVYWQATRGTGMRSHNFTSEMKANLWITLVPKKIMDLSKKYKLITIEDTRFQHCNIKTLNLIPNVMAAKMTEEAGCNECVFHRNERVTECGHSNVNMLKNGVFVTPPADEFILPGISRKHLIELCHKKNIPVEERIFTLSELMEADEVIVSSSGQLCMQTIEIDGKPVGGKAPELLRLLQKESLAKFLAETE